MSWDSYIENLKGSGHVEEAAIIGQGDNPSVWACTPGYKHITVEEMKRLLGKREDFGQSGPSIAGTKCRMIKDELDIDKSFIMQLKTRQDDAGNAYFICIGKTLKALIIGRGKIDTQPGNLNKAVFGLTDYLRQQSY